MALERSKAAPLTMDLSMDNIKEWPGFPNLIKPHIQKTTILRFGALTTVDDLSQTLPDFPQSTPNLQVLILHLSKDSTQWDRAMDPFKLFPTTTLRCLILEGIPLYPSFLSLRSLTQLKLKDSEFSHTIDTLLRFIKRNALLESVTLQIKFVDLSLRTLLCQAPIENRLKILEVHSEDAEVIRVLISGIALQRGAHLCIVHIHSSTSTSLTNILSDVSNLANLSSPNCMKVLHQSLVELSGPNGSFSIQGPLFSVMSLTEFSPLSCESIQELHFAGGFTVVFEPFLFPALKVLVVGDRGNVSDILSNLFSSPESCPLLEILAFSRCELSDDPMERLIQFASNRKETTSMQLSHIFIAHADPGVEDGFMNRVHFSLFHAQIPSASLISELKLHVPVDVLPPDTELPSQLVNEVF